MKWPRGCGTNGFVLFSVSNHESVFTVRQTPTNTYTRSVNISFCVKCCFYFEFLSHFLLECTAHYIHLFPNKYILCQNELKSHALVDSCDHFIYCFCKWLVNFYTSRYSKNIQIHSTLYIDKKIVVCSKFPVINFINIIDTQKSIEHNYM